MSASPYTLDGARRILAGDRPRVSSAGWAAAGGRSYYAGYVQASAAGVLVSTLTEAVVRPGHNTHFHLRDLRDSGG